MADGLSEEELAFLHAVFDLARDGDVELLSAHVDAGLPVDLTNSAGDTLLLLAAYHRHADLVRALLARGADHARVNDRGQTALAAAVFRQDTDAVTALLDAGADPELGRQSALATATVFELSEMTALLTRSGVVVRRATVADVAVVRRLVQEAYEGYVEPSGHRRVPLDSDYDAVVGQRRAWVAEVESSVVGLLVLQEAVDHLLVEDLAVAPAVQGRGIGLRLLDHAEQWARAGGTAEVRLATYDLAPGNLASYSRRGYRETHRETEDGRSRVFFAKDVGGHWTGTDGVPERR